MFVLGVLVDDALEGGGLDLERQAVSRLDPRLALLADGPRAAAADHVGDAHRDALLELRFEMKARSEESNHVDIAIDIGISKL